MYGRMARLPVDINTEKKSDPDVRLIDYQNLPDPDEETIQQSRQEMEASIKKNILAAQKKQKKHYDRVHGVNSNVFAVGAKVLKKDFRRKKRRGGKLDYRWEGPFFITASLGKGLFKLKDCSSERVSILVINIAPLTPLS